MKQTIVFPTDQLPASETKQLEVLIPYFSGLQVRVSTGPATVAAEVAWPTEEEVYVDPRLREGLDWWQSALLLSQLPLAVRQRPRYQLSLTDNWTLYAWSRWLARQQPAGCWPEQLVVLHIDDHRDCMAPLLFTQAPGAALRDGITGELVDMAQPETIAAAIRSGAIAVGSFLTVLLHHCPRVQLRHLFPAHRTATAYQAGPIGRLTEADTLRGAAYQRPALQFEAIGTDSGLTYLPTDQVDQFLADIPAGAPVLLHVDMDYFNNRFDGDSDWTQHATIHDPPATQVRARIQHVVRAVLAGVAPAQLADITVALSPGFFPAELWQPGIAELDALLS